MLRKTHLIVDTISYFEFLITAPKVIAPGAIIRTNTVEKVTVFSFMVFYCDIGVWCLIQIVPFVIVDQ